MATSNPTSDAMQSGAATATVASEDTNVFRTVLPYGIAIIAQLPLLLLYYKWLWNRPHYASWFAFAILATAGLTWVRWPRDGRQVFKESMWSNLLAIIGVVAGLAGVAFVEPWFAALSVFTLLASLLARTIDRDTGRSLWIVTLPLFMSLAIPGNYDIELITMLQTTSAHLTSRLLDLASIGHYMPGTVIETPTAKYGVEEACSGVQSFFLLIFVAVTYCVWLRRPFFRSLLLFISAMVWSVFMNCLRIFLIPVFHQNYGIDLAKGIQHDLLGWSTMAMGILLVLSTDQFLMFLFGPVDAETGSSGPMGRSITKVWNSLIAGEKDDDETKKRRRSRNQPLSALSQGIAWTVAGLLVAGGLWAMVDIASSFNSQKRITFFSNQEVIYPIGKDSMPETVKDWTQVDYQASERDAASDLGEHSELWNFRSPNRFFAFTSFDQTFPGWHELTRCYRNAGWILEDRIWKAWEEPTQEGETPKSWPYIEAHLSKPTGERGIVLFSLFDGEGEGYQPPREWSFLNYVISGARNRLGNRTRARLFQSEAYQTQVFVYGYGDITPAFRDEITDRYLEIREIMRREFLAAKNGETPPAEE